MLADRSTLHQFLIEERRNHPEATGDLNALIGDVAIACKAIAKRVAYGGIDNVLGAAATTNIQGERQQKLRAEFGKFGAFRVIHTVFAIKP